MKFTSIIGAAGAAAAMLVAAQSAHATTFPDLTITESQTTSYPPANGDYFVFKNTSSGPVIIDLKVSGGAGGSVTLAPIVPGASDTYFLGNATANPGDEGTAFFSYEIYGSSTVYSGKVKDVLGYGSFSVGNPGTTVAAAAVPEPATWAMMLLGFGMVGSAIRTRRRQTVRFAAA
jgi:hypothetical protein